MVLVHENVWVGRFCFRNCRPQQTSREEAPLNSFFSVGSVRRLQPMIEERVQACLERMRGLKVTRQLMNVVVVTSAFSNGEFCSGRW